MDMTNPDVGLVKALQVCNIPDGPVVDLGCGPRPRNLILFSGRLIGAYDTDWEIEEELEDFCIQHGFVLSLQIKNVLFLELPSQSQAVVLVGMIIYNPKVVVQELLRKTAAWLKQGGLWHGEFATYNDATINSDFIQMGSMKREEGSYVHSCGDFSCSSLGLMGGSFWNPAEAEALIKSLGLTIVHAQLDEWVQLSESPEGQEERIPRSFYRITAQKL